MALGLEIDNPVGGLPPLCRHVCVYMCDLTFTYACNLIVSNVAI